MKISTAEVLTIIAVSMKYFHGNYAQGYAFMTEYGHISNSFTYSALSKRIRNIPLPLWSQLLNFIHFFRKKVSYALDFVIDTFPIAVCRNVRMKRCRLYSDRRYCGYNASKKEYFYGVKVSVITDNEGCPIEVKLAPGSTHDMPILRNMQISLPEKARLFGDAAYTNYKFEDQLYAEKGIRLIADRKSNALKHHTLEDAVQLNYIRKSIETTFSLITRLIPRKVHAIGVVA